jgi:glycosyltransferase involved in cell wall biosynthesis
MNQPAYLSLVPAGGRDEVTAELANEMGAMLDRDDFPDRPLLDQAALRERFGSYVDRARAIHARRRKSGERNAPRRRVVQLMYMLQDRGGETVARQLARGFRERGYEMRNIGVYREVPETSTTADFEILYDSRPSLVANLGCFFRLVRMLRRERPEAVIMHGDFAQVIGAPAALLAGVRQRIVINHLALGISKRSLRLVHAVLGTVGLYRHIVFVGESARRSADGLPRPFVDRSIVIPNTVAIERGSRASARARFGIPDDAIVLLNVGSLTHQKNQMVLIEALAFLPEAMLVIVGDGPLEDFYRTASARYGDRVRLLGRVPSEEMGDVYAMADVFVFPSRYEGRPLALLEAATCGLPIVASPIAENVEVVGAAAHYVPSGGLPAWIAALRGVVEDAQFREGLRRQTETVDKGCTDATIESYIDLLSK